VTPYVVGNNVYLRFRYDTKDAMGMNMVTIATRGLRRIEAETDASLVALSGNLCSDKKPAAINAVEGRGRSVAADVEVPREVVEERLHTTPESIAEINTRKEPRRLREGGRARLQRPRRQRGRGDVPRDRAGRGPGRRGGERDHDRAETTPEGDLYLSVSLASLEVGTDRRRGRGSRRRRQGWTSSASAAAAATRREQRRRARGGDRGGRARRRALAARGARLQTPLLRARGPRR